MSVSAAGPDVGAAFAALAEILASDLDIEAYLAAVCRHGISFTGAQSAAIVYADGQDFAMPRIVSCDETGGRLARGAAADSWGPWAECMTTGTLITVTDVRAHGDRWPWFTAEAVKDGLLTATVIPVGPSADAAGAIALLGGKPLDAAGILLALSLADAAWAGIILNEERRRQETAIIQLQSALTSRIVIEQAKGILAERWRVTPDEAFGHLRRHARTSQRGLAELARAIIDGTAELTQPDAPGQP